MPEFHAGFRFLVEAMDCFRDRGKPLSQDLDRDRGFRDLVFASVDPGEGPFGQVEQNLVIAEEETRRVPLPEPFELPARQSSLPEQNPQNGIGRIVGCLGASRLALLTGRQTDERCLFQHVFSVEFGHETSVLIRNVAMTGGVRYRAKGTRS